MVGGRERTWVVKGLVLDDEEMETVLLDVLAGFSGAKAKKLALRRAQLLLHLRGEADSHPKAFVM